MSMDGGKLNPTSPGRREGPLLTFIPEGERTIDHRLQFILVGKGARALAQRMVDSEQNDSYRPRKTPRPSASHTSFNGSNPLPGNLVAACERSPSGASSESRPNCRRGSCNSVGAAVSEEDDNLVLFCPANAMGTSLARVRLRIVEGFSASMPSIFEQSAARDAFVALLHWRPSGGAAASAHRGAADVAETMAEFTMRVAEMGHCMHFLPLAFLLSINESDEQSQLLEEAVAKRTFKDGRQMQMVRVEDDTDESILDAVQDLVSVVIKERARTFTMKGSKSFEEALPKSCCCAVS